MCKDTRSHLVMDGSGKRYAAIAGRSKQTMRDPAVVVV